MTEEIEKINKESREKNRIKRNAQKKEYRNKNEEKLKEYQKEYYKNNRNKRIENTKEYRKNNPDKRKEYDKRYGERHRNEKKYLHIKKNYGITPEEHNLMVEKQNNCCAICGKHQNEIKTPLGVDHDHKTGKIRGLLCHKCNTILGYSNDEIQILLNAINYLNNNNLIL
jgi:hypothetical protein